MQELITRKGRVLEETDYASSNPDMLNFRMSYREDLYDWNGGKLRFKNRVDVVDFQQASAAFPALANIQFKSREKLPYFVDGLDALTEAMARGETVAVEGGPCLFDQHEVTVVVRLKDGEERLFDYTFGQAYLEGDELSEPDRLGSYFRLNGERVEQVEFRQGKRGLTPQEYFSLRYPFELAAALGGELVIPLPDMSYRKYLLYVLETVSDDLRARTLEEFDGILNQISDMYLDAIGTLQARFQIPRFVCVHRRDPATLNVWYEKRAPYVERRRVLQYLTRVQEKVEPIKDYISMPALPFYLFGATNILQADIVREADSYRKCRKAHKSAFRMGCILTPELLSRDGVHTFNAALLPWKDYGRYDGYESPVK